MVEQDKDILDEMRSLSSDIQQNIRSIELKHKKYDLFSAYLSVSRIFQQLNYIDCVNDHQQFLSDINQNMINLTKVLEKDDLEQIIQEITKFQQISIDHQPSEICQLLWKEVLSILEKQVDHLHEMEIGKILEPSLIGDLSIIDSEDAYNNIIDPLTNKKRLDILIAVAQGNSRFNELESYLELQAGHLIYHLNPLKKGQYVKQDDKKNYSLTEKGKMFLIALKKLYREFK